MSTSSASPAPPADARLLSLDAYRGLVMVALAGNGFGIAQAAKEVLKNSPDDALWKTLHYQFEHVAWVGGGFWDMIQPSFMFMVGVALPYSAAKRAAAGDSYRHLFCHTLIRAIALILLGIGLSSNNAPQTNFAFMNVLTQIGLGYVFLFFLWNRPRWLQLTAAAAILTGYWSWFALSPVPTDVDWSVYKLKDDWQHLTGFAAHWQIHTNPAADVDRWFLNLFPRPEPFVFNAGGYQTLNFIPSLVTMLFGLMAGEFIRRTPQRGRVFLTLIGAGVVLVGGGWALDHFGFCPLVKRIWTPSWTLFSGGWTLLLLGGFYGVIDGLKIKFWAFPLVVAGMNSITLYMLGQLCRPWTRGFLATHFGKQWLEFFGAPYAPILESCAVLLVFWLFVYWLYRQRAFLKI